MVSDKSVGQLIFNISISDIETKSTEKRLYSAKVGQDDNISHSTYETPKKYTPRKMPRKGSKNVS